MQPSQSNSPIAPRLRDLAYGASANLADQPPPPGPGALGRQLVEPVGQSRKGGDRLLSLRLFALELGGVLGVARGELGDHPLGLRPLGGQAGGICGIIRDVDWRTTLATITSVLVTVSAASKVADPNAAPLLIGEPSIVGDKVMQTMGSDPPGGFHRACSMILS